MRAGFAPATVLDFGAGSGILAIGAAQSGARVEAVETDRRASENARQNAELNRARNRRRLRLYKHLRKRAAAAGETSSLKPLGAGLTAD